MSTLADGGITSSVMAKGGKVWNDREKLGAVVATGFELRKKFAIVSLIITIPLFTVLFRHNQANWQSIALIMLATIPVFYTSLSNALFEITLKLHQSILILQKIQLFVAIARLFSSFLLLMIFPWTFVAFLAMLPPTIYGNKKLHAISSQYMDQKQSANAQVEADMLKMVKRILPGSVFFILSGQISIWLVSVFGTLEAVAYLGALGRIAMLLSSFNMLIAILIVPRFAKLAEDRGLMLKYFVQITTFLLLFVSLALVAIYALQDYILYILGENYRNLNHALLLKFTEAGISLIAGVFFSLSVARGWVVHPLILMLVSSVAMLALALVNDLSTLDGVLMYGVELSLVGLLLNGVYFLCKIMRLKTGAP
jgi:O-antigen/teichoic acid export membrane protein